MINNLQHYFRFYLALLLFGLLLVGIRWQSAPLGATVPAEPAPASGLPHVALHTVATR